MNFIKIPSKIYLQICKFYRIVNFYYQLYPTLFF